MPEHLVNAHVTVHLMYASGARKHSAAAVHLCKVQITIMKTADDCNIHNMFACSACTVSDACVHGSYIHYSYIDYYQCTTRTSIEYNTYIRDNTDNWLIRKLVIRYYWHL